MCAAARKACRRCAHRSGISTSFPEHSGETSVLETIVVILLILWVLGLVTSYTMGGFIHILLVVALIVIVVRVIQGRRL